MAYTDWLIGEFELEATATIVINGNNAVITAGSYYLSDATPSRSLLAVIQTALQAHVASATVVVRADRLVQISAAVALTLTIPASLQAVLGLPGSPSVGSTVTASSVSTHLWSPGWQGTSVGHPRSVDARPVYDRVQTSSPTGLTTRTTVHGYAQVSGQRWNHVARERVWTSGVLGQPGEFARFHSDVLVPGYRFKLYRGIDEGASTAVTWTTAAGPYVARDLADDWWTRDIPTSDIMTPIELQSIITREIA